MSIQYQFVHSECILCKRKHVFHSSTLYTGSIQSFILFIYSLSFPFFSLLYFIPFRFLSFLWIWGSSIVRWISDALFSISFHSAYDCKKECRLSFSTQAFESVRILPEFYVILPFSFLLTNCSRVAHLPFIIIPAYVVVSAHTTIVPAYPPLSLTSTHLHALYQCMPIYSHRKSI